MFSPVSALAIAEPVSDTARRSLSWASRKIRDRFLLVLLVVADPVVDQRRPCPCGDHGGDHFVQPLLCRERLFDVSSHRIAVTLR